MNKAILLLALLPLCAMAGEPTAADREVPQFDKYYMVFLMRPDEPEDYGSERNTELQAEHRAHLRWLWEEGYALVAGPFFVPDSDKMRGIVLLRGDLEKEKARELAEMDPRVKAGQLRVDIREWYTGAGVLAFPQQPSKSD